MIYVLIYVFHAHFFTTCTCIRLRTYVRIYVYVCMIHARIYYYPRVAGMQRRGAHFDACEAGERDLVHAVARTLIVGVDALREDAADTRHCRRLNWEGPVGAAWALQPDI